MKRYAAAIALSLSIATGLAAQDPDPAVLAYRRNFVRSSLDGKLALLREASSIQGAVMGPLFDAALRFVVDNTVLLGPDPQLKDLAILAATEAGRTAYKKSIDNLWTLFQAYKDQDVRAAAIASLGYAGAGEVRVAENLNAFLASQNSLFRSGAQPEYPALSACIDALGRLGDGSSFPVLFSAYVAAYTPELAAQAAAALGSIKGDYRGYLLQVIAKNPPLEKAAAFAAGMENPNFSDLDRGELSEAAMAAALAYAEDGSDLAPAELQALLALRSESTRRFTALKREKAAPLAIRHFHLVQGDYDKGFASKTDLLEAIACLGFMGSKEAAQTLVIHLQLTNDRTDKETTYDEALIMAIINALGELGDKSAFNDLVNTVYNQYYSSEIKNAARSAILKLKL